MPQGRTRVSRIHGDLNLGNLLIGLTPNHAPANAFIIDLANCRPAAPTAIDFARLETEFWHEILPTLLTEGKMAEDLVTARGMLDFGEGDIKSLTPLVRNAVLFVNAIRREALKILGADQDEYVLGDYMHALYFLHGRALAFPSVQQFVGKCRVALTGAAMALDFLHRLEAGEVRLPPVLPTSAGGLSNAVRISRPVRRSTRPEPNAGPRREVGRRSADIGSANEDISKAKVRARANPSVQPTASVEIGNGRLTAKFNLNPQLDHTEAARFGSYFAGAATSVKLDDHNMLDIFHQLVVLSGSYAPPDLRTRIMQIRRIRPLGFRPVDLFGQKHVLIGRKDVGPERSIVIQCRFQATGTRRPHARRVLFLNRRFTVKQGDYHFQEDISLTDRSPSVEGAKRLTFYLDFFGYIDMSRSPAKRTDMDGWFTIANVNDNTFAPRFSYGFASSAPLAKDMETSNHCARAALGGERFAWKTYSWSTNRCDHQIVAHRFGYGATTDAEGKEISQLWQHVLKTREPTRETISPIAISP